jgi:hypothetical protein
VTIELAVLNVQIYLNSPPGEGEFPAWVVANAAACGISFGLGQVGIIPPWLEPAVQAAFCVSGALAFLNEMSDWAENPTDQNLQKAAGSLFESEFACILASVSIQMEE